MATTGLGHAPSVGHGWPGPVPRPLPAGSASFIHPGGVSSSSQTLGLRGPLGGCALTRPVLCLVSVGSGSPGLCCHASAAHSLGRCQPSASTATEPWGLRGVCCSCLWGTGSGAHCRVLSAYSLLPGTNLGHQLGLAPPHPPRPPPPPRPPHPPQPRPL